MKTCIIWQFLLTLENETGYCCWALKFHVLLSTLYGRCLCTCHLCGYWVGIPASFDVVWAVHRQGTYLLFFACLNPWYAFHYVYWNNEHQGNTILSILISILTVTSFFFFFTFLDHVIALSFYFAIKWKNVTLPYKTNISVCFIKIFYKHNQ